MPRENLLAIESELRTRYIDRDDEIHGLLLAALSGQHIELLGPPGTAKSMLAREFCEYVNARFFSRLMTQYTTPDEVIGPVDIRAYKELGVARRILTGKVADCEVAFLDEVYKAGPAILTCLLTIMQERMYENDGQPTKCPLLFLIGASNELPDENEGLQALRDRFLLRYNPGWIVDPESFAKLIRLKHGIKLVASVTSDELQADQAEAKALELNDEAADSLNLLWATLKEQGIQCSPRRWRMLQTVMAAESWLMGEVEIVAESTIVGCHILWEKPEQIRVVHQIVSSCINPSLAKALELKAAAQEAVAQLHEYSESGELLQALTQLDIMLAELRQLKQSGKVATVIAQVAGFRQQLMLRFLGAAPAETEGAH